MSNKFIKRLLFFIKLYLKFEEDCKKTRKAQLFIFGSMRASTPTDAIRLYNHKRAAKNLCSDFIGQNKVFHSLLILFSRR